MTMDQKLDELIKSVSMLQKAHDSSHKELDGKLRKLETDVAASQESQDDATEEALKRLKRDKPYEFRRKGHEEQYRFNSEISDHMSAAASQLSKLRPSTDKDKATLEKARKELEEGMNALAERQKYIRIADQSEHSWETVAAYIGNDVATNEDDARRIEKAEKTAEQRVSKQKRNAAATVASHRAKRQLPVADGTQTHGPSQPAHYLLPRPLYQPQPASTRPVGPCFYCGEVGHLKLTGPRLSKSYPFDSSHRIVNSDVLSPTGPQSDKVVHQSEAAKVKVVNSPKTKSVERETCQVMASDQSESPDTNKPSIEGIDAGVAESWEGECEGNHDLALSRFWEIGHGQVTDVQGRLQACLRFWEHRLQPAPWIISCIREGYKLPLCSLPKPYIRPNQASAITNREFVTQAISELVQNCCVVKVPRQPHICSPLSVVSNSMGKQRLVINLHYLNRYLWKDKFKYEDMRIAMLLFQKGDYMFSFDLKSGYHHIDIFEPHRQFLGFCWDQGGTKQFYMFTVLPFGLATACYAFTKLFAHW